MLIYRLLKKTNLIDLFGYRIQIKFLCSWAICKTKYFQVTKGCSEDDGLGNYLLEHEYLLQVPHLVIKSLNY